MPEQTVKELTAQLEATAAALQRSERLALASRYAGAVMHEVNNPLEALSNLVFLTKTGAGDPTQVLQYMNMAEEQLSYLGEITRKTLSFYKDQSEARDFNLVEIVNSALALHSERSRIQNIEIRRQIKGPAIAKVFAGEILQILSNLILNAHDAAPAHNAILYIRVATRGQNAIVTIADNGEGIEESVYQNLFQAHRTTKSHGTGLGLWLSRGLVCKHGGQLRCRSTRRTGRNGTAFRLSLPLSRST